MRGFMLAAAAAVVFGGCSSTDEATETRATEAPVAVAPAPAKSAPRATASRRSGGGGGGQQRRRGPVAGQPTAPRPAGRRRSARAAGTAN